MRITPYIKIIRIAQPADDFLIKMKKGVDKSRGVWYSNKAVGAVSAGESPEDRERKKGLDKDSETW